MTLKKLLRLAAARALRTVAPRRSPPPPSPSVQPALPRTKLRLPHPVGWTLRSSTIDFAGGDQFGIGRAVLATGLASYEPEVFSLIAALIETSARPVRMLDIGANVGVFSLAMAGLFGDAIRVTAFEPMPELASFLRNTAARNGLSIDVKQMALGAQDAQAKFYLSSASDASNSLNESFREHSSVIDVDVRTLDALLADESDAGAYVLKLDTESTEPDVLAGARAFIAKHRPPIICEVLANRTEKQIEELFRELGYIAVHITDSPAWDGVPSVVGDATYEYRDWLFLPAPASESLRAAFARWMTTLTESTATIVGSPTPAALFVLNDHDVSIRRAAESSAIRWDQVTPRFAIQYFDPRNYRRKPHVEAATLPAGRDVTTFAVRGAIRQLDGAAVDATVEVFAYGDDGELSGQATKRLSLRASSSPFSLDVTSTRPAVAYRIRWWFAAQGPAAVELAPIAVTYAT